MIQNGKQNTTSVQYTARPRLRARGARGSSQGIPLPVLSRRDLRFWSTRNVVISDTHVSEAGHDGTCDCIDCSHCTCRQCLAKLTPSVRKSCTWPAADIMENQWHPTDRRTRKCPVCLSYSIFCNGSGALGCYRCGEWLLGNCGCGEGLQGRAVSRTGDFNVLQLPLPVEATTTAKVEDSTGSSSSSPSRRDAATQCWTTTYSRRPNTMPVPFRTRQVMRVSSGGRLSINDVDEELSSLPDKCDLQIDFGLGIGAELLNSLGDFGSRWSSERLGQSAFESSAGVPAEAPAQEVSKRLPGVDSRPGILKRVPSFRTIRTQFRELKTIVCAEMPHDELSFVDDEVQRKITTAPTTTVDSELVSYLLLYMSGEVRNSESYKRMKNAAVRWINQHRSTWTETERLSAFTEAVHVLDGSRADVAYSRYLSKRNPERIDAINLTYEGRKKRRDLGVRFLETLGAKRAAEKRAVRKAIPVMPPAK